MSNGIKKKKQSNEGLFRDWKKALVFAILPFLVGTVAAVIYFYPGDSKRVKSLERINIQTEEEEQLLAEELKEEEEAMQFLDEGFIKGKISLVLDDVGYEKSRTLQFINMGIPVSIAVLPGGEYSREIANISLKMGYSVILHMPMQSEQDISDRTNQFLLKVGMREREVIRRLDRALAWVPGAGGISNHMGSRFTRDSGGMRYVALYLKKKKLFFLDSKTTAQSVAPFVFRVSRVKFVKRDVFIDNDNDPEKIRDKFEELKIIASQAGSGVGILHPGPVAIDVIEELVKESLLEGYRFVTLSEIVNGS